MLSLFLKLASFASYIVHTTSMHLTLMLQPLQFSLLPLILIILSIISRAMVYSALTSQPRSSLAYVFIS